MQISYTLATIEQVAHQLWQYSYKFNVLTFEGDMGAGKTTLISTLCHYLGVQDSVSSPTFALINEYHFEQEGQDRCIYHMDWYRMRSTEEAVQAGMEDCLYKPGTYAFVEWPQQAPELLYKPYVQVRIEVLSETERRLEASVVTPGQ